MKFDKNMLEEAVNAIFTNPKTEGRKISGYRGCITRGYVDIQDMSHCGDITCPSCNLMKKALEDEVQIATFKFYDNDTKRI